MQTFGMIVTAEPYFAVTQPGSMVVLENSFSTGASGRVENIDATYELLGPGAYSSSNTKIDNAIFGIDRNTPLELFEARNAIRVSSDKPNSRYRVRYKPLPFDVAWPEKETGELLGEALVHRFAPGMRDEG